MKPTLKSINAALPRFDYLRRNWGVFDMTGFAKRFGHLKGAYADIGEDGNVTGITLYAVGDAMQVHHYYRDDSSVNITGVIERVIDSEPGLNRGWIVDHIQELIALDMNRAELFAGRTVTLGRFVYWANMVTEEIYRQTVEAEMAGSINGYKVADIFDGRIHKYAQAI